MNLYQIGKRKMRRTAAQQIRSLEMRIARLEKEAGLFDIFGDKIKETLKAIANGTGDALVDYGLANTKGDDGYIKKPNKIYQLEARGHIKNDRQQLMFINVELDKEQDLLRVYLTSIYTREQFNLVVVPNFSSENPKFIIQNIKTIVKNSVRTPRQRQKIMALYQY